MNIINSMQFLASTPHKCSYLEHKNAVSVFADPDTPMSASLYNRLAEIGFRRSGEYVYAPNCPSCSACIPVRIPTDEFVASRNQKRTSNRNRSIEVRRTPPVLNLPHFELFQNYVNVRHAGGGMDNPSQNSYLDFIASSWSKTILFEFYLDNRLVAVAVVDEMDNAFSAVYTFFDPQLQQRSLGTFAVLWIIEEAKRCNKQWLYLGYLIEECQKMRYKAAYRPLHAFINGQWINLYSAVDR